MLKDKNHRCQC